MDNSNDLIFNIQKVALLLTKKIEEVLQSELGIGYSQYKILIVLQKTPSIKQKQIAKHLEQTEASISRQMKYMYDNGLLQVLFNPEDRREHRITLTTRGQRVYNQALEVLNNAQSTMLNQLNKQDQEKLLSLLKVLHDYFI